MAQSAGSKRKEWINGTFTQIPNAVFAFLPDMSASAFVTYCVLAKRADGQGRSRPHIKTLAVDRGVSQRAINRDLNELHDLGLVKLSRKRYGNEYTVVEPDATQMAHLRNDTAGASEPTSDATEPSPKKRQNRRVRSDKAVANMRTIRREQETRNNIPPNHPDSSQVEDGAPINSVSEFGAEPDMGDPEQPCQDFSDSPGEEGRIGEGGRGEKNDGKNPVSTYFMTETTHPYWNHPDFGSTRQAQFTTVFDCYPRHEAQQAAKQRWQERIGTRLDDPGESHQLWDALVNAAQWEARQSPPPPWNYKEAPLVFAIWLDIERWKDAPVNPVAGKAMHV